MKNRITYIILFLFAFIFQLKAQPQYVEYEYVDGTKEREALNPNLIVYNRSFWNDVYSMTSINIDFAFDSLFMTPNSTNPVGADHRLIILFQDSKTLKLRIFAIPHRKALQAICLTRISEYQSLLINCQELARIPPRLHAFSI